MCFSLMIMMAAWRVGDRSLRCVTLSFLKWSGIKTPTKPSALSQAEQVLWVSHLTGQCLNHQVIKKNERRYVNIAHPCYWLGICFNTWVLIQLGLWYVWNHTQTPLFARLEGFFTVNPFRIFAQFHLISAQVYMLSNSPNLNGVILHQWFSAY